MIPGSICCCHCKVTDSCEWKLFISSRVSWLCPILVILIATNAPKLLLLISPSLPSPSGPLLLLQWFLAVDFQSSLTAHILEEEEQTQDICGKWDYETGLTRPLLTLATMLMAHDTTQTIVTKGMFGSVFLELRHFRCRLGSMVEMCDPLVWVFLSCAAWYVSQMLLQNTLFWKPSETA